MRITEYIEAVSQHLHLEAGLFSVHRLQREMLGANNIDLVLFFYRLLDIFLRECIGALRTVGQAALIFLELTLDCLLYEINRRYTYRC